MPDEIQHILRRLDVAERNSSDLAKSITALTSEIDELTKTIKQFEIERAVRKEQEIHRAEQMTQIKESIAGVHRLGWWVLAAFGTSAIALIANFLFKGGFYVP